MKRANVLFLPLLLLMFSATCFAQEAKPYKEGPVTEISYIKTKAGKFDDYMSWLDGPYKTLMDAQKKAGLIIRYAVFFTQPRTPSDADLILTVTYANMAALDRIDEGEAVAAKVMGTNQAQNQAAIDRGAMRDVLGGQLVRELVLK